MIRQMIATYFLLLLAVLYMVVGEFWLGLTVLLSAAVISSV
jgi:hypothetical protein